MMEEVSDDTSNGESSFEFIGGKNNINVKDIPTQGQLQEPSIFTPITTMQSVMPFPTQSTSAPPVVQPQEEARVQFYDPAQYYDPKAVLMAPIPVPPEASVPPPAAPQGGVFMQPQQTFAPSGSNNPLPTMPPQQNEPIPDFKINYEHVWRDVNTQDNVTSPTSGTGILGWFKNSQILNKVAEKAKSSVDSVITTLDPGMKEIINSGGDTNIIVASGSQVKISAIREAFQLVFGKATVDGVPAQATSIAPQPVGFSAGLKAVEERCNHVRQQGVVQEDQAVVAVENFLVEMTPDNWFDMGCLYLHDSSQNITLQVYTQATPVSIDFVSNCKSQTPIDYPLAWSGCAVTIGEVIGGTKGVHHSEWHEAVTGVPRREMLFLAAKTLAGLYKRRLLRC